jgi:hypothetical protein
MTTLETYWQELTALALLGTARRTTLPTPAEGPPAELIAQIPTDEAAQTLLQAAAVTTLYRKVGSTPASSPITVFAPAPDDAQQPVGSRVTAYLQQMLGTTHSVLLPEYLAAIAARGRRVPDSLLVDLLERGAEKSDLRPLILPVLGQRGYWLANMNPTWEYVVPTEEHDNGLDALSAHERETWETGSRTVRRSLLQQVRTQNPAKARDLLALTWASEKADDRAAFIESLATGLSMDDEPLLEAALDDRSKEVRSRAADLLARLPQSRLAQRMAERAVDLLSWKPGGLLRGAQISVELPEACNTAMQRDGIEPKAMRRGIGERAWWLMQIISRTPPATFTAHWNTNLEAIIGASVTKEWRELLRQAWAEAAQRYADEGWIEGLLGLSDDNVQLDRSQLASLLPPTRQERLIINLLWRQSAPLDLEHPAFALLRGYEHPWSNELATAVIERLRRAFATLDSSDTRALWHYRPAFEAFALRVPAKQIGAFLSIWPPSMRDAGAWGILIANLEALLTLRRDALAALDG